MQQSTQLSPTPTSLSDMFRNLTASPDEAARALLDAMPQSPTTGHQHSKLSPESSADEGPTSGDYFLVLRDVPQGFNETDIKSKCQAYGPVTMVSRLGASAPGVLDTFVVKFASKDVAKEASHQLNNNTWHGCSIQVELGSSMTGSNFTKEGLSNQAATSVPGVVPRQSVPGEELKVLGRADSAVEGTGKHELPSDFWSVNAQVASSRDAVETQSRLSPVALLNGPSSNPSFT
mmetsp:Transcript_11562/g.24791  ORF Transcript_11562/g.24791 Transcript_11562/m.24791 type:complete len:233 (+) Transcript_11562:127-825(+)